MRVLVFVSVLLCLVAVSAAAGGCFPMSRGWNGGPPAGTSRNDWWCGNSTLYGFLGFSYPVEDDDCGDYSYNGFKNDFSKQKSMYNASFVRFYLPVCKQTSFWVNAIKAARDANMGLIVMIWWDWGQNDPAMTAAENAFLGVFSDNEVGPIAQYIVHSVEFGDELGEEGNYWLSRMQTFKTKLAAHNIPLTITDDWDRGVYQSNGGLSSFGKQVNDLSDQTHAHIQPFYHPNVVVDAFSFWNYFQQQMNFLAKNLKRPIFVSQTMWAYNKDGHQRGGHDEADNMQNYQQYFATLDKECTTFKNLQIGWFFHTWFGEPGFDIIGQNGQPVCNWKPTFC